MGLDALAEEWIPIVGTAACVMLASLAAGLTMGIVSLDAFDLQVLLATNPEDTGSQREAEALLERQRHARRVLPFVENHHLTLVTLLLMNSIANEAMPLFLDELLGRYAAIVFSVGL